MGCEIEGEILEFVDSFFLNVVLESCKVRNTCGTGDTRKIGRNIGGSLGKY